MAMFSRYLFTRRTVLKLGAAIAALAAGGGSLRGALAADASTKRAALNVTQIGTVSAVEGGSVLVSQGSRSAISATVAGFPAGIMPRVGDLVAIETSPPRAPEGALCAPEPYAPLATPVVVWAVDVPAVAGGSLMIGERRLVDSPSVLAAAEQGTAVAVATLDTTLIDHQVLAVRSV